MNDDIEFGDVEEAAPSRALRPDQNQHYAVAAYGEPQAGEVPIYVDLDVLAEIEEHARSDMSVELGGVLLGGTFVDDGGRPFVVISDILFAAHYESTKGSFKFTHDTWGEISRQREQLAPELAMVGWYHTHPGWGVFLSGMDLFICENFFGKKLDVALVVDPCRGDRGMFQWTDASARLDSSGTGAEPRQTARSAGFFVTASRFRAVQLEHFVAELQTERPPAMTQRYASAPPERPGSWPTAPAQGMEWVAPAMVAGLVVQCLLLAVIAMRLLSPVATPAPAGEAQVAAAIDKLNTALATMQARRDADLAAERLRAKGDFLDAAFRELKSTEAGSLQRLEGQFEQAAKLTADVNARDAEIRELRTVLTDARGKMQAAEALSEREEKRLQSRIEELAAENTRLTADLKKNREALASLSPSEEAAGLAAIDSRWWWIAGAVVAAVALVAGVWWFAARGASEAVEVVNAECRMIFALRFLNSAF